MITVLLAIRDASIGMHGRAPGIVPCEPVGVTVCTRGCLHDTEKTTRSQHQNWSTPGKTLREEDT
jgi:hypothetical protein